MDLDGGRFLPRIFHLACCCALGWHVTTNCAADGLRAQRRHRHWAFKYNERCILITIKIIANKNKGLRETWMGKTVFSPSFTRCF